MAHFLLVRGGVRRAEILSLLDSSTIIITLFRSVSVGAATAGVLQALSGLLRCFHLTGSRRLHSVTIWDGSLEQLMLLPLPAAAVMLAKVLAHWIGLRYNPFRPGSNAAGWMFMAGE